MRSVQVTENEWVRVARRGERIECCDCGLTHRFTFRVRADRVEFRVLIDRAATAAARRRMRRASK